MFSLLLLLASMLLLLELGDAQDTVKGALLLLVLGAAYDAVKGLLADWFKAGVQLLVGWEIGTSVW